MRVACYIQGINPMMQVDIVFKLFLKSLLSLYCYAVNGVKGWEKSFYYIGVKWMTFCISCRSSSDTAREEMDGFVNVYPGNVW